jgi:hypothetical protein
MISRGLSLNLCAFGTASADLVAIGAMRKRLPEWAPSETPAHFLKHADEQTIVAVAAVDDAMQRYPALLPDRREWAVIAAPRFIGRLAGADALARYERSGGPAISPHVIAQHSLHSVSGALSILLGSRKPNFGVGGGGSSLTDGLVAALTQLPTGDAAGVWLISTCWDPEPVVEEQRGCTSDSVCQAVALALASRAGSAVHGRLSFTLNVNDSGVAGRTHVESSDTVIELCAALTGARAGRDCRLQWKLPWGATVALEVEAQDARLPMAA